MRLVMLPKIFLAFLPPQWKLQYPLYKLFTSFRVGRSLRLLTIHHSFRPSLLLLLVHISGITHLWPTMFPTLTTSKATAAGAFLSCTNLEIGSKLPKFSANVVSARANQYSTKAPSLFRSLILNSRCRCDGRRPFS